MRVRAWGALLVCGVSLLLGCRVGRGAPPTLALHNCRLKGVSEEVRCGTLDVLEDRDAGRGRTLSLNIAVVPALAPTALPDPLFILVGGPGQAATEHIQEVTALLERVHRRRDLVFVDQRGTGKSNPLSCEGAEDAGISRQFEETVDTPALQRCLAGYADAGTHPALYTTPPAVDDLDDVRAALGDERINLWGVSYGSRAALVYMRRHPEHVRAVVLDSVAPPSMSLPLEAAEDGQRAFQRIFESCAADAACAHAFPDLQRHFEALLAGLAAHPAHVRVRHPLTGAPVELTLTKGSFVGNLHGLLYIPEISALLPLIIERASAGDFEPFVAQAAGLSGGMAGGVSQGMFFSVMCSEDAPLATPAALAAKDRGTWFGDTIARSILDVCAFWPKSALPAGYHAPVASDAPTLLLSGELDPVTPPRHADEARARLTHARAVVVPGVGHSTSGQGCIPKLIAQFLDQGSTDGLPVDCVKSLTRPPFFVSFAGPTP